MPSFSQGLEVLERILERDPKGIDDYAANPFGVLVYNPAEEILLRSAVGSLKSRLSSTRTVKIVSLAQLLERSLSEQLAKERLERDELFEIERQDGFESTATQLTELLDRDASFVALIAEEAKELDAAKDVLFLIRAGVLYPFYRVSPILESLSRHTRVPTILCYPGRREGQTGLHFLNHQDALRGYRQRIF